MSEDRIARALRSVGDNYLERNPADVATFREGLERKKRRRSIIWAGSGAAVGAMALAAFLLFMPTSGDDEGTITAEVAQLTRKTRATLTSPAAEVAGSGTAGFVSLRSESALARIDEGATEPAWVQQIPAPASDLIQEGDDLWVAMPEADAIAVVEQATGQFRTIGLGGATNPTRLAVGSKAVRVATDQGVVLVDRATQETRFIYEGPVTDIAMGASAFWVLSGDNQLAAIDPNTGADAGLPRTSLSGSASEITYLRGSIWVAPAGQNRITRIDEETGRVESTVGLLGGYTDIDAGEQGMWVLVRDSIGSSMYPLSDDGELGDEPVRFEAAATDLSVNDSGIWVVLDNGAVVQLDDRGE